MATTEPVMTPDEHDLAVMGAGIELSNGLNPFLGQNAKALDTLAGLGVIDARQLAELRRCHQALIDARIARREPAATNPTET